MAEGKWERFLTGTILTIFLSIVGFLIYQLFTGATNVGIIVIVIGIFIVFFTIYMLFKETREPKVEAIDMFVYLIILAAIAGMFYIFQDKLLTFSVYSPTLDSPLKFVGSILGVG